MRIKFRNGGVHLKADLFTVGRHFSLVKIDRHRTGVGDRVCRNQVCRRSDCILAYSHSRTLAHSHTRALVPSRPRALAPSRPRALAPSRPRALVPSRPRALALWRPRALVPSRPRALAPSRTRSLALASPCPCSPARLRATRMPLAFDPARGASTCNARCRPAVGQPQPPARHATNK
jgi:hypothetical protein